MSDFERLLAAITGPQGALALLFLIGVVLWLDHRRTDRKRDEMLDRQLAINESYATALPELSQTVKDAIGYVGERRRPLPARRPVNRQRRTGEPGAPG